MSGLCWPVSVVLWLWACTWMFAFYFGGFVGYLPPPPFLTQLVCPSTFLPSHLVGILRLRLSSGKYRSCTRHYPHVCVKYYKKNKIWRIRILRIYRLYRSAIPKYIESKKNNCKKSPLHTLITNCTSLFQYHFSSFTRYSEEVIKMCYGIVSCCLRFYIFKYE